MPTQHIHEFITTSELVGDVYEGTFSRFRRRLTCSCGDFSISLPESPITSPHELQSRIQGAIHGHMLEVLCRQFSIQFFHTK